MQIIQNNPKHASAVIIYFKEKILLVLRSNNKKIFYPNHYGLFGGAKEKNETYLGAAKRELLEETGLKAKHYREIQRLQLSNSASDETAILYVATNLEQFESQPDETELLEIKKLPVTEAIQMVINGEITDVMSVAALLKVHILLQADKLAY